MQWDTQSTHQSSAAYRQRYSSTFPLPCFRFRKFFSVALQFPVCGVFGHGAKSSLLSSHCSQLVRWPNEELPLACASLQPWCLLLGEDSFGRDPNTPYQSSVQDTGSPLRHGAHNDTHYLIFSWYLRMKFTKTAQYHDATNDTRYLIFSRYFPWKSPKQLSTMMLQMTDFISIFHGISHEIHQNGSVPRCHK